MQTEPVIQLSSTQNKCSLTPLGAVTVQIARYASRCGQRRIAGHIKPAATDADRSVIRQISQRIDNARIGRCIELDPRADRVVLQNQFTGTGMFNGSRATDGRVQRDIGSGCHCNRTIVQCDRLRKRQRRIAVRQIRVAECRKVEHAAILHRQCGHRGRGGEVDERKTINHLAVRKFDTVQSDPRLRTDYIGFRHVLQPDGIGQNQARHIGKRTVVHGRIAAQRRTEHQGGTPIAQRERLRSGRLENTGKDRLAQFCGFHIQGAIRFHQHAAKNIVRAIRRNYGDRRTIEAQSCTDLARRRKRAIVRAEENTGGSAVHRSTH